MKISAVLGGLLMLLGFIDGLGDVSVTCSDSWLRVKMRQTIQIHGRQPQQQELSLGNGCPVNAVDPHTFQFLYTLTFCGIRVHEFVPGIFIESSVKFEPTDLDFVVYIPVFCYFQRNFPMMLVPKSILNPSHKRKRPVGQNCSLSCELEDLKICPRERLRGILIESSVTYAPVVSDITGYSPIICFVHRKFPFAFIKRPIGINSGFSGKTQQGAMGRKNSTSSQRENLGASSGISFGEINPQDKMRPFWTLTNPSQDGNPASEFSYCKRPGDQADSKRGHQKAR
ncbi:oocyte-secreted protein 4A [Lemur catta]|uniref:oocyte-secreted protein 4A n=1 Tax=Lemur catta TaxID=9447 RepID=UPI001E268208|nr:oocyte-secreted protein 4A [Lemur catta]